MTMCIASTQIQSLWVVVPDNSIVCSQVPIKVNTMKKEADIGSFSGWFCTVQLGIQETH